jgi:hypothetical protein
LLLIIFIDLNNFVVQLGEHEKSSRSGCSSDRGSGSCGFGLLSFFSFLGFLSFPEELLVWFI